MTKKVYLIIGFISLVIIIIVATIVFSLQTGSENKSTPSFYPENKSTPSLSSEGKLTINVNPKDATIEIANQKFTGGITNFSLRAGEYTALISRNLFENKKIKVIIEKNKESNYDVVLELKNEADENYENLNIKDQKDIDLYDGINTQNDIKRASELFPMISNLPYYTDQYHIDYGFLSETEIFYDITIQKGLENDQSVKNKISQYLQSIGINSSTAKINYYYEILQ